MNKCGTERLRHRGKGGGVELLVARIWPPIEKGGDARAGRCARSKGGKRWVFGRGLRVIFLFLGVGGGARRDAQKFNHEVHEGREAEIRKRVASLKVFKTRPYLSGI